MTLQLAASIVYAGRQGNAIQKSNLKFTAGGAAGPGAVNVDAQKAVLRVDFSPEDLAREQAAYDRFDWVAPEYETTSKIIEI